MTATFTLLTTGHDSLDARNTDRDSREKPWHVASTVCLLRDGDTIVVVDPGMVEDRTLILDPLAAAGISPGQVTDVVFGHHHPDDALNAALFSQRARPRRLDRSPQLPAGTGPCTGRPPKARRSRCGLPGLAVRRSIRCRCRRAPGGRVSPGIVKPGLNCTFSHVDAM
ncbi:MBL fold metallo-hydrolase [Streptomyces aureocirculatus]|uniref:MBL fold metallo-hydrolase n=1 Tax=Streptomyces aureocirculatus TaxID=67275 RepID=UPI001CEC612A|nr:MBL fold metallo-hydrolase [Streptomyces aureocirculatus]